MNPYMYLPFLRQLFLPSPDHISKTNDILRYYYVLLRFHAARDASWTAENYLCCIYILYCIVLYCVVTLTSPLSVTTVTSSPLVLSISPLTKPSFLSGIHVFFLPSKGTFCCSINSFFSRARYLKSPSPGYGLYAMMKVVSYDTRWEPWRQSSPRPTCNNVIKALLFLSCVCSSLSLTWVSRVALNHTLTVTIQALEHLSGTSYKL